MYGSNCETWRWICDDLSSNILIFCWSYNYSEWSNCRQWICEHVLGNQLDPMVQMLFQCNDAVFQDDKSPIRTGRSVQSWFEEHEDACQHLPWPAQSPDLNIIESLRAAWESGVRSRFPPPWSLKQPDVLHEEWYNIPLETIQNLYEPACYVLLTVHPGITQGKWPTWCTVTLYKTIYYFNPVHDSSITVLIIRRSDCINTNI